MTDRTAQAERVPPASRGSEASAGGLRIARVAGIPIDIHQTWLIAFALITWSLALGYYPTALPDATPVMHWILGAVSAIALFTSVLLHELSHSLVARAKGLRVRGITLFVFGGVSNIEAESERPGDEFLIAIVGPLTSLALAAVAFGVRLPLPEGTAAAAAVGYLALINLAVGIFNLVPGFPLDGGRILRAGIWAATGSLNKATRWASYAGQIVGLLMIFAGVSLLFAGNLLGGIWIAFIGWFLSGAAESSRRQQDIDAALRGVRVATLMDPTPATADAGLSVREFVFRHVMREGDRAVVVMRDGRMAGIATITDVKDVPSERWDQETIGTIMTAVPLHTVSPDSDVTDAMRELVSGEFQQLPVVDDGRLVGLIGREDVLRSIVLRDQLKIDLPRTGATGADRT